MKQSMSEIWLEEFPHETKCPLAIAFQVENKNSEIENVIYCRRTVNGKNLPCFGLCNNHKILKEHFEMKIG